MTGLGPSPWRPLRLCASHTVSDFLDPKFGRKFQFFRVYCEGYSPPRPSALEPQPTQQSLFHHRGTEFAGSEYFLIELPRGDTKGKQPGASGGTSPHAVSVSLLTERLAPRANLPTAHDGR